MTFEDFFAKKKIDLTKMEKADPGLFAEFKSHFELMGEKSFDHTKKFWFNKLRHLYHLTAPAKAPVQPASSAIANQAELLSSPTIEQKPVANTETSNTSPASRPAFKPRNIPAKPAAAKSEEEKPAEDAPVIKKPAFKPRNIKPAADANSIDSRPGQKEVPDSPVSGPGKSEEAAKPIYKPRFNPRNIPKKENEKEEQPISNTEEKSQPEVSPAAEDATEIKPAYKPRFKMKNVATKPAESQTEKTEDDQASETRGNELVNSDLSASADENVKKSAASEELKKPEDPENPKPAYKPKFSMRNIQSAKPSESIKEERQDTIPSSEDNPPAEENRKEENVEKPAYKPRFNMKNIKPKSEE